MGILIVVSASIDISLVKEYSNMGDVNGIETDILLIVIGLLILIIAAFGCFGAIRESPKLLYIVSILYGSTIVTIIFDEYHNKTELFVSWNSTTARTKSELVNSVHHANMILSAHYSSEMFIVMPQCRCKS